MLTRWNQTKNGMVGRSPFSVFGELQQLGRMLEEWDHKSPSFMSHTWPQSWGGPRVDLVEQDDNFLFLFEVPGFQRDDINLSINAESLTISGERKIEAPEGYTPELQERSSYKFSRSFAFPTKIDVEKVTAELQEGVLQITVAKAPEVKPRQIEVQVS